MEDRLVLLALEQIAEALGHSNSNPISASLLCLEHGISFDEMGKIMVAFNQILRRKEFILLNWYHLQGHWIKSCRR